MAMIRSKEHDYRDPKLCVTPDGRLMLTFAASLRRQKRLVALHTLAAFSTDGRAWSSPVKIGEPFWWLWRPAWHDRQCYAVGYSPQTKSARLYTSPDGERFSTLVPRLYSRDYPVEASVGWDAKGEGHCLFRRIEGSRSSVLGMAQKPFDRWRWSDVGVAIDSPNLLFLPDGRMLVAGRKTNGDQKTVLWWGDPESSTMTECLELPSGGDTGYPGLLAHEDELWVSYHSSHEGKAAMYLARIRL